MPIVTPKVDTNVDRFDYTNQDAARLAELIKATASNDTGVGAQALSQKRQIEADQQKAAQEGQLKQLLQKQQQQGEVDVDKQKTANNITSMQALKDSGYLNGGGSVKVGDVAAGADPMARMAMRGPQQAQAFLKTAQGAYKGLNDQLDSSKATIDSLNLGNSTGDKLALLNEARLALGGSGSRAFGQTMALLSGDPTMASDAQRAYNWLQNTPNVPTLQPAQRDAIREAVYARMPQVEQQLGQTQTQLSQQGPIVAPQTDTAGLIGSFSTPASQKMQALKQMQAEYAKQRQGSPNPISAPATANPNPTTLDRLRGLFGMGGAQAQAPAAPQATQPAQPGLSPQDLAKQELQRRAAARAAQQPVQPQTLGDGSGQ